MHSYIVVSAVFKKSQGATLYNNIYTIGYL